MNPTGARTSPADAAETLLRAELAQGDAVLASVGPVLRHLVASDDHSVFSEEVVARTRGLIEALATQLLRAVCLASASDAPLPGTSEALIVALIARPELLGHCHSLAIEAQLAERLAESSRLDPVLSPLVQAQLGSQSADTAALAMQVLAAQARFIQSQRRMETVAGELPADLLHAALGALDEVCGSAAGPAVAAIRADYDEARSRHGLLARLIMGLGPDMSAALDPAQAGTALFLSALSLATMHDRGEVTLATSDGQQARLATLLAAAGCSAPAIQASLFLFHPDCSPPRHYLAIERDAATMLLAGELQP
jgi:hypothetical protein